MLLTITTTHQPATDLGFLLHKHPDKFQSIDLSMGKAHIFYPDSSAEKTTIALLLDIDPIDMVKKSRKLSGKGFTLGQYVNDRPYVASSFMSVALAKAFRSALNGQCKTKPELIDVKMPFMVKISVLPAPKGGEVLIRSLFEPLGYQVKLDRHILAEKFTGWGDSKYFTLELSNKITTQALLSHLYVLIPVLEQLKKSGAKRVIDLGCGEGKLLRRLLQEQQFRKIVGMDVSYHELSKAKERLHLEEMAPRQRERIQLFQGALTYKDQRLEGYDAAAIVEVIEHLDYSRLESFERVVFEFARPKTVILTTPNSEYNQMYQGLEAGKRLHEY